MTALARHLWSGGVILCYHNVIPQPDAGSWDSLGLHMPLPTFERQMRWLAANYELVGLEQWVARLSQGASLRGVVAVTFDDGYKGVFDLAWPLLRDLGIPATVFVVAEAPGCDAAFWWDHPEVLRAYSPARHERWLTALRGDSATIVQSVGGARSPGRPPAGCRLADWQTIAGGVRSGLRLGVHSATHRSLPALDERDLQREVVDSRDIITCRTGVVPEFFAYPYGRWNDGVRRAVRSASYRAAFTLDHGRNAATADLWVLPRLNVPAGIEDAAFQAWTAGLRPWRRHAS